MPDTVLHERRHAGRPGRGHTVRWRRDRCRRELSVTWTASAIDGAGSLDLDFVRSQFPAFDEPLNHDQSFFENAGGSFACRQTIEALTDFYTRTKVQPYSEFATSAEAGEAMDRSRARWAEALGVASPGGRVRAVDLDEHLRAGPGDRRDAAPGRRGRRHEPGPRGQHRSDPPGGRAGRRDRSANGATDADTRSARRRPVRRIVVGADRAGHGAARRRTSSARRTTSPGSQRWRTAWVPG